MRVLINFVMMAALYKVWSRRRAHAKWPKVSSCC